MRKLQTMIAELLRAGRTKEDAQVKGLIDAREEFSKQKDEKSILMTAKEKARDDALVRIGNIVHASVVTSNDEDNNDLIKTWIAPGKEVRLFSDVEKAEMQLLPHHKVLSRLEGYDPERGQKVMGHRGYFLRDAGVRLNQALINYGMDFLRKRKYTLLQTPFMMGKDIMARCAQLEDFDEQLYKVVTGGKFYIHFSSRFQKANKRDSSKSSSACPNQMMIW
jgi:seryl-tRNA synthetase